LLVVPANWQKATDTFPCLNTSQYSHLLARDADASGEVAGNVKTSERVNGRTAALAATPIFSMKKSALVFVLFERFGSLLGVAADEVEPSKKIPELGVDSLMAIEIKVFCLLIYTINCTTLKIRF
jgi:Phosphopantetheine attachment site